jgi:hypothetical protein
VDEGRSADQSAAGEARLPGSGDVSGAPLPLAYGGDSLVLMVRDPTWSHAYWDMSIERVEAAKASLGGGTAFLRLISVPDRLLLAEYEVAPERGEHGIPLPEPGRSYVAELALIHYGRKAVLARSNVAQGPPRVPTATSAPVFVSRAQQREALATGLTLELLGELQQLSPAQWAGLRAALGAVGAPAALVRHASTGSEARLSPQGSQPGLQ